MSRVALKVVAALTVAWIVASLILVRRWTPGSLLSTIVTWVDVPLAAWLAGLGWVNLRRRSGAG